MPKHDFIVIDGTVDMDEIYGDKYEKICIDDDLILYMKDTLNWIETYWNDGKIKRQGLDYYGSTAIVGHSITKLKEIIISWIELFKNASEDIILTGCYMPDEDKYEKLHYEKNRMISQLNALVGICNKALQDEKDIIHLGI